MQRDGALQQVAIGFRQIIHGQIGHAGHGVFSVRG
jgi:hypothetical protein